MKSGTSSLNEDTLGSQLKSGIAQYVALEITRGNNRETNRAITRYLPWLYHPPSTVQQGLVLFISKEVEKRMKKHAVHQPFCPSFCCSSISIYTYIFNLQLN